MPSIFVMLRFALLTDNVHSEEKCNVTYVLVIINDFNQGEEHILSPYWSLCFTVIRLHVAAAPCFRTGVGLSAMCALAPVRRLAT